MNYIILENIRSAYNVGNMFRTADALGWGIILSGYTPSPSNQKKISKTALGAEKTVPFLEFEDGKFTNEKAINRAKENNYYIISAEITENSIDLKHFTKNKTDYIKHKDQSVVVIFGNEVSGVSSESLKSSDIILHIPMKGKKDSLNVGQSGAIFMRELSNYL